MRAEIRLAVKTVRLDAAKAIHFFRKAKKINTGQAVPIYPGPRPGGVHPGLTVSLRGLSKEAARIFMEIEFGINMLYI